MWPYTIQLEHLLAGKELDDGDVVYLTVEDNPGGSPDHITVELDLRAPITWWNAIKLHAKNDPNYAKTVVQIQDNQTAVRGSFPVTDLDYMELVLWKAKTFGMEKPIYMISDAKLNMTPKKVYKFVWAKD